MLRAFSIIYWVFAVLTMPAFFQYITLANPLRWFLEVVRVIFLKGAGIRDIGCS